MKRGQQPNAMSRLLLKAGRIARLQSALRREGGWEARQCELGAGCVTLMYHHVGPPRRGALRGLTVSGRRFERQMGWLADQGYCGIRPSQWLRWLDGEGTLPARPVMVTFDDGYADIAEHALPVLERYGFGACVFVVTRLLGGANAWDEVRSDAAHRLLSGDQVREWSERGIEFGAHGRTHADLTGLSAAELNDEVTGSKSDLESLLDAPVTAFAYPYGAQNDAVRKAVREHFGLGFGIEEGVNFRQTSRDLQHRILAGAHDTQLEFAAMVRWGGRETTRRLPGRKTRAAEDRTAPAPQAE